MSDDTDPIEKKKRRFIEYSDDLYRRKDCKNLFVIANMANEENAALRRLCRDMLAFCGARDFWIEEGSTTLRQRLRAAANGEEAK